MENAAPRLFTVGHSNLDEAAFLGLLRGAGVTAVADVRSAPHSRRYPHFSRRPLEVLLRENRIAYVLLGRELGGRPAAEHLYDPAGFADYERIRATPAFREGVERVLRGLETYAIALMCSEEDPLDCHRGLMIAPALKDVGAPPTHIRRGGRLESMAQFEQRLQDETGVGALYGLEEAYRIRNAHKAHRLSADGEEP